MISPHPQLDERAADFFRTFSRAEYALKAAGWLLTPDGDAIANWNHYADHVALKLADLQDVNYRTARDYLLSHPPRKQIVRAGRLEWSASEPNGQTEARQLVVYLRRVRNNLFHGGKFNGHWFDPERSSVLLEAAHALLVHLISVDEDVRAAFHNN